MRPLELPTAVAALVFVAATLVAVADPAPHAAFAQEREEATAEAPDGPAATPPPTASAPTEIEAETIRIGSKKFTESVLLGELATRLARQAGAIATHSAELGGTRLLWNALLAGEIDVYPDYTGTIRHEILQLGPDISDVGMRNMIGDLGIAISKSLGFSNTYALGMKETTAERLGITKMSDLQHHPRLRFGFTNEFMARHDGWPGLRDLYGLARRNVRGLDHDLAYKALNTESIDVTDIYTTDAEIDAYALRVLEDDLGYFPDYAAVMVYRIDLDTSAPNTLAAILQLEGSIDADEMIRMNAAAKLDKRLEAEVAADFLGDKLGIKRARPPRERRTAVLRHTLDHLLLVGISLFAAILVALPLGILAAEYDIFGRIVLWLTGVLQTIPALAMLVFMIPALGIGAPPALAALFLYSLLPIVRNTHAGLKGISPGIIESADAMGLSRGAKLRLVRLPMASRSILAGIKTSAVINVGTATLGALVGAGGYGRPILTGIRLDDVGLILEGALPAAGMALAVEAAFELAERIFVPKGLRLKPHSA